MLKTSQIHDLQPSEIRPWHEVGDFREIAARLFGFDYDFLEFDGSDREFTDRLTFRVMALGPYEYRGQSRVSDLVFDDVPFAVVIESGKQDDYEFIVTNGAAMAEAVAFLWSNRRKDRVLEDDFGLDSAVTVGKDRIVAIANGRPRIVRREFVPAGLGSNVVFDETVLIEHIREFSAGVGKGVWYGSGFRVQSVMNVLLDGLERAVNEDYEFFRVDEIDDVSGDWTTLVVRTPDDTFRLRFERWNQIHSLVGIGSCVRMDSIGGPEVFDELRARSDIKP